MAVKLSALSTDRFPLAPLKPSTIARSLTVTPALPEFTSVPASAPVVPLRAMLNTGVLGSSEGIAATPV